MANLIIQLIPETVWDVVGAASIKYSIRQGGGTSETGIVSRRSDRWRGYEERKKRRIGFVDLRRVQPVAARVGYSELAKSNVREAGSVALDEAVVERMGRIMGRSYEGVRLAITNIDKKRKVPVIAGCEYSYSGFHGGAGEVSNAELLSVPILKYSMFLIDEVETSLHPRTQRRLIRDLAEVCREQECQIVLTTHSPYVLDELPPEARIFVMDGNAGKTAIPAISTEFAMTQMDDEPHPECEVYVEDESAKILLQEILASRDRSLVRRLKMITFGGANVGRALGQMVEQGRFPRKSIVFLDGDQSPSGGCLVLPRRRCTRASRVWRSSKDSMGFASYAVEWTRVI